jgi:GAF domain-containing protein
MDFEESGQPKAFFNLILESALSALGIPKDAGLGVIHLYNPDKQLLELHGICGNAEYSTDGNHSVNDGVGIISWVALTKRALIIQDLQRSEFRHIHVSINKDTKTELAVPLEIGGELIGTMCLVCTEENRFLPHHAYSVWYAANQAVLAYQLYQLASINRKLLDLCRRAATEDAHDSLAELATLAKDYLKASVCEISRYNDQADSFKSGGASYAGFEPQIRKGGWTEYVRSKQRAVCISDIGDGKTNSVHVWDRQQWFEATASDEFPKEINPSAIQGGIQTALGIPITIKNDCIGVAWVMYKYPRVGLPKPAFMSLALGFAAEAGLVLDSIERREVDLKVRREIDAVASAIAHAIEERWQLRDCTMLDCHVISIPLQSKLGGDFYAGKVIDTNTVGILILDGQGHGVGGSLHMLPLMTAFESVCQSYSTAHVISALSKTAETLGVGGCAVYAILTAIDGKSWLSVTSAGPETLLHLRRLVPRNVITCDHLPKNAAPPFTHPLKEPFMDHRIEVEAGDVIVLYSDGIADPLKTFNQTHLATFVTNFLDEKNVRSPKEFDPKEIAEAILEKSRSEQGGSFSDDVTVIVARVN